MKLRSSLRSRPGTCARLALGVAITAALPAFQVEAADRFKANNTNNLNLSASWDTLPGSTDVAVWNSTVAGANTAALGAALSWQGIRIANPGGLVTIGNTSTDLATNTTNVLTLGTSGIDLSGATQNLLINGNLAIGGNQTWQVASGRTLQIQTINTISRMTGSGNLNLTNSTGSGTATFDFRPGNSGSILFTDQNGFFGYSGSWTIGSGVLVKTLRNGQNAWGSGTITLAGGTVAQQQNFSGTWTNGIILQSATSSTIDDANTSGTRSLKLQGVISGSGTLTFAETGAAAMTADTCYVLTAANTMNGTVILSNANSFLRVGGNGGNDVTLTAGPTGSLGSAAVTNNGTLSFTRSNAHTVSNTISGSGQVRVGSTGITGTSTQDLTLSGANSYTGGTELLNGTLQINALSGIGTYTSGNTGYLAIKGGGTFIYNGTGAETTTRSLFLDNGAATIHISDPNGALLWNDAAAKGGTNGGLMTKSGPGALTLGGSIAAGGATALTVSGGTLTLNGAANYAGATSVTGGKLVVNNTLTASTVTVGAGTLSGSGTLGPVAINAGGTIDAGNASVGNLSAGTVTFGAGATTLKVSAGAGGAILNVTTNNGLSLLGTTTLNVVGAGLSVGSDYTLVDYVGVIGGNDFAGFTLGTQPPRVVGSLVNNTGNTSVDFHVSSLDKPKWTGATDGLWDTTTSNWQEIISGNATAYLQGDDVLFDGSASGTTSVILNSTVSPAAVTIDSSTLTYSLSGTGKISGTTALTKAGSSVFTLANSGGNDYSGGTTISGGTLKLGVANALPTAGNLSVGASGTLDLGGFAGQVASLTGSGSVTNSGAGLATLTVANSASATFDGIMADGAGAIALLKSGAGTLTLNGANLHSGGTTISTGKLVLGNGGSLTGAISNNATLEVNRSDTYFLANDVSGTGTLSQAGAGTTILTGTNSYGATTVSAGILQVGNGGSLGSLGSGAVSVGTGATLAYNRGDTTAIVNVISGAGAFRKEGAGTLTLGGNSSFTGGATINAGTIVYGHANALANSGSLAAGFTLTGGTVDFNGQSNYNPGPAHASGSLPTAVLLLNQTITLGGAAGTTTIQDSGNLGFGSFLAGAASATAINYNAANDPGTSTISAKFLAIGSSAVVTRSITVGDSASTLIELDMTGQLGAAPDGTGGFGDGKQTTIRKEGAGTLRISAANYFPQLQVSGGTLLVNNALALGQTKANVPVARGNAGLAHLVTVDGGTVDLNGFNPSVGGLSGGGQTTGVVTNNGTSPSTLTVGSSGASTTFGGTLQDGTSTVALTKTGAGTLTVTGTNTYTGATTVSSGTLLVSGSLNGSLVTVNGGTLAGNGGSLGATTIGAGGNLAPGLGIATLNVAGNLSLAGTATFELNKTGLSLTADHVNATALITLGGILTVSASGDTLTQGDTFDLFDGPSIAGSFTAINLPTLGEGYAWNTSNLTIDGSLTVIPEPGTGLSLLGGLGLLLGLGRRRRR